MKKYTVRNKLTSAVCGVFSTANEAGRWVEEYTHEQNEGLSPHDEQYCSPFLFELEEREVGDIDSYETALEYLGVDIRNAGEMKTVETTPKHYRAILALSKLFTIAEAWNTEDGFIPDFSDENQYKYFPWFVYNNEAAGFVCTATNWAAAHANAGVGSRLCFGTPERATAFAKRFDGLYNEFLLNE